MSKLPVVNEKAVEAALSDEHALVVDTRSSSAFIGWRLEGEEREGHIKGATDFSAGWLTYTGIDEEKREELLQKKVRRIGLKPDTRVILYDMSHKDAEIVAAYFEKLGVRDISYFWLGDWTGEMTFCPGYYMAVPVSWVKAVIDGEKPEHFAGGKYKIFEVSWKEPAEEFLTAHIPGSVHIDSEEYERGPEWIKPSDKELEDFACANGITADTTVIIYAMTGFGAAQKLTAVLRYMGVEHVHWLNGSMQTWIDAGYPTESGNPPKTPVASFGATVPAHPEEIVDMEEAKEILKDPSKGQIIDMRTWKGFIGESSEYDYVPLAGRIPGTIWCHDDRFYMNPDCTMGNPEETLAHWKRCGVDLEGRPVFLCGSGAWCAATVQQQGVIAGLSRTAIYEGGWCEWQLHPENPYETGIPEEYNEVRRAEIEF